jgi:hypothetical protein
MSQIPRTFHFRRARTLRAALLVAPAFVGCGSGAPTGFLDIPGDAGDGASPGMATEAGATEAGPSASQDGSLVGDGGGSCGSSLDMQGCSCTPGTSPRSCYPGPKSQAGVGACADGSQSCVTTTHGEITSGQWGPCQGAGQPGTCSSEHAQCGSASDGCGGLLTCGTCSGGTTCGAGGTPNVCGAGSCTPTTCLALGVSCGMASDGCTGQLDCGSCTAPQTCGGSGQPGVCGCAPTTCTAQGATCGTLSDGCGGTLDCGSCTAPQTCGGGGTANQCGTPCTPTTCTAQGATCGTPSDGCGGTLDCGSCTAPQTCGGGGTANQCGGGCTPTTCAALGLTCGTPSDGCGGTLTCGGACTCGPMQVAAGGLDALGAGPQSLAANTEATCQAFCNTIPDTFCCLLFEAPGDVPPNGDVCYAITDPSCVGNFIPAPNGGPWYGTLCTGS